MLHFRAEDLDAAILDRCDESLCFSVPDEACRKILILDYFEKFVKSMVDKNGGSKEEQWQTKGNWKNLFSRGVNFRAVIDEDVMNDTQLHHFVKATDGFSGREIAKLMLSLQGAIYSSIDGKLDYNLAANILEMKIKEHEMKAEMRGTNGSAQHETQHYNSTECPLMKVNQSPGRSSCHETKQIVSQFRDVSSTCDDLTDEDFSFETKSNICSTENHLPITKLSGETAFPLKERSMKRESIDVKCTCDLM